MGFDQKRRLYLNPVGITAGFWAVILIIFVIYSPGHLLYDEGAYLPGALLLDDGYAFSELLVAPFDIPTGPLYAVVHAGTEYFTNFAIPEIRYINLIALSGCWLLTGYVLHALGYEQCLSRSATIIGVPMIWVTSGMALTEIPAMFFSCMAVALVIWGTSNSSSNLWRLWLGFLLSGVSIGIAISGRQLILPVLTGYALIAIYDYRMRWPAVGAIVAALVVCLPIFIVWGNLVPPSPRVEFVDDALQPLHGILALCYLGVILCILAPSYFLTNSKKVLAAAVIGGLIGVGLGSFGFEIASGVSGRLPEALQPLFQRSASGAMGAAVAALGVATLSNLWDLRRDCIFVLCTCLMGGLAVTAVGVSHQFSSRYLITAFPFVILSIQPFLKMNVWAAARLSLGAIIGLLSLANYYDSPAVWEPCQIQKFRAFCIAK